VVFTVINITFCVAFTLELVLRLYAHQMQFFIGDGWAWNLFDGIVVLFSIVDELSQLLLVSDTRLLGFAGVLRMLRLGRLLRLVRLIRVIPALKSMVTLISASVNSFFWTGVLLLILMYCVAVYFTELATDVRMNIQEKKAERLAEIQRYWGSLGQEPLGT
ncbi:unnamed protein product, partial [Effrenium voratum]